MRTIPGIPRESTEPHGTAEDPSGTLLAPPGITHRPQTKPYLDKCTAPEALDSFIRILSLQRMAPTIPLDWFVMYTGITEHFPGSQTTNKRALVPVPQGPKLPECPQKLRGVQETELRGHVQGGGEELDEARFSSGVGFGIGATA